MTKKLIDSGPSPRGFHRLESFLRCPTQYWWRHVKGVTLPPGDPLVRGTLVHVGLAHHYAFLAATQRKVPSLADTVYAPEEAMGIVAARYAEQGERLLPVARKLLDAYVHRYPGERVRVIGIEQLLETAFEGYRYTARADLVVEDSKGKVWIWDHKVVGRIEDKVFRRYAISGQFHGLAHLGVRTFGPRFAGLLLNVIGVDGRMERRSPEPAPWLYGRWPHVVADTERQIERLADLPVESWPAAASETVCVTPYGLCDHFEACRWGPEIVV